LVEYALILVLVAVVVIVIMALLGTNIRDTFADLQCNIRYAGSAPYGAGGTISGAKYNIRFLYQSRSVALAKGNPIAAYGTSAPIPADGQGQCGYWGEPSGAGTRYYVMIGPP
jgi:hypothetical protein